MKQTKKLTLKNLFLKEASDPKLRNELIDALGNAQDYLKGLQELSRKFGSESYVDRIGDMMAVLGNMRSYQRTQRGDDLAAEGERKQQQTYQRNLDDLENIITNYGWHPDITTVEEVLQTLEEDDVIDMHNETHVATAEAIAEQMGFIPESWEDIESV